MLLLLYMNLKDLILQYLDGNRHMQLATVSNGQPWLCTVYFVSDENFNLYWTSAKVRQHSREISANPKVAATVVKDTERKQALQLTGEAYEVKNEDLERVDILYSGKFGDKGRLAEVRAADENGRAYYVFKPSSIALWDEVNFPESPKQQYELIS